jgi:hypothetical protein
MSAVARPEALRVEACGASVPGLKFSTIASARPPMT